MANRMTPEGAKAAAKRKFKVYPNRTDLSKKEKNQEFDKPKITTWWWSKVAVR